MGALLALALGACSGGGDGEKGKLRVERYTNAGGYLELIVSVEGIVTRKPGIATSARQVGVVCSDRSGRTTVSAREPWPFPTEPGFGLPHIHQSATPQQIDQTVRCRLTGTRFPIQGELSG